MAVLIKCDTCDSVSPNKQGLHIANGWTHVKLNQSRTEREFIVCDECVGKGARLSEGAWIERVDFEGLLTAMQNAEELRNRISHFSVRCPDSWDFPAGDWQRLAQGLYEFLIEMHQSLHK